MMLLLSALKRRLVRAAGKALPRFERLVAIAVAMALTASAQNAVRPLDGDTEYRSGLQITSISGFFSVYDSPSGVPTGAPAGLGRGTLYYGGVWSDAAWYERGARTETFLGYNLGYNAQRANGADLNGFNHALEFSLRSKIASRVSLYGGVRGESTLVLSSLLRPTPVDAGAGLYSFSTGTPGESLLSSSDSALSASLFGARRYDAVAHAGLEFTQSPRLTWRFNGSVVRVFPARQTQFGISGSLAFPGVTNTQVGGELSYTLSRRATIGFSVGRLWSASSSYRVQTETASASLEYALSRRWFARAEAGGGAMRSSLQAAGKLAGYSYRGAGGIGISGRTNKLMVAVKRDLADTWGLGAGNTITGELTWSWSRPNGAWSWQSGFGYERLAGGRVASIEGWLAHAIIARQLTRHLSWSLQAAYSRDFGHSPAFAFQDLTRRGAQMSIAWTPARRSR